MQESRGSSVFTEIHAKTFRGGGELKISASTVPYSAYKPRVGVGGRGGGYRITHRLSYIVRR